MPPWVSGWLWLLAVLLAVGLSGGARAADDERVIWEGADQFVKLVPQDRMPDGSLPPPNEQPVQLSSRDIQMALGTLTLWKQGGLFSEEQSAALFTTGETQLLGRRLADALAQAGPDQDVVFAVVSAYDKALIGKSMLSVAGRVFVRDGKLHMILGDVLRETRDPEAAVKGAWGDTEGSVDRRLFPHKPGRRSRVRELDSSVVVSEGVEYFIGNDQIAREDWLVLDLPVIVAEVQRRNEPEVDTEARKLEAEAARMALERRQMREEMARMRKEMRELSAGGGGGASTATLTERLATLEALRDQGLISEQEYAAKRKDILDQI